MDAAGPGGGVFITVEGPDGAGKSTQARLLADALRRSGREVCLTREPGGTPLGERLREFLLDGRGTSHRPLTDALLFNAARAELVHGVIAPALASGAVVVCDRYADSTLAYQGYGDGLDLDALRRVIAFATGGLGPDVTVLVDVPARLGLGRRSAGPGEERNRFEEGRHDEAFHRRVREGFLALAAADPRRWAVVDGTAAVDVVAAAILRAVEASLAARVPPGPLAAERDTAR